MGGAVFLRFVCCDVPEVQGVIDDVLCLKNAPESSNSVPCGDAGR